MSCDRLAFDRYLGHASAREFGANPDAGGSAQSSVRIGYADDSRNRSDDIQMHSEWKTADTLLRLNVRLLEECSYASPDRCLGTWQGGRYLASTRLCWTRASHPVAATHRVRTATRKRKPHCRLPPSGPRPAW